jgi:octaprenyl-diphosphate synthase
MNVLGDLVAGMPHRGTGQGPDIDAALARVVARFHDQIASELPQVDLLCRFIERYRGKMLRPSLAILAGQAAKPGAEVSEAGVTIAAVIEMIHIATLVHDDVLDDADTRRGGPTINRMHGSEAAVIFGDYLISQSFHLCSGLGDQRIALRVGEVTSTVCAGEMLQLSNRGNPDLDEATYFSIIERKTAALIAVACELGARVAGATEADQHRLSSYGRRLGMAFQIQDDLLDITGAESVVGKPLGKDLEKGKLTLPVIHFLRSGPEADRDAIRDRVRVESPLNGSRAALNQRLDRAGSIAYARSVAARLIAEAKADLAPLADSPAKAALVALADAVIARDH